MAQWKKIIVSGSDAELRTLTSSVSIGVGTNQIISTDPTITKLSGSFSGSFYGDGSQLTGVTATDLNIDLFGQDLTSITVASTDLMIVSDNGTEGRITVSQLANPLTGTGLTEVSGKITLDTGSTHFTSGVKHKLDSETVVSSSAQIELTKTNSGSFTTDMVGEGSNLYYTDSRVKDKLNTETVVSGAAQIVGLVLNQATDFGTGRVSADNFGDSDGGSTFTGSFVGDGSQLTGLVTDLRISGSTGNDVVSLLTDDLSIIGTTNEIETTVTDGQIQIGIVSDPTFTGTVTITGDLLVQGTTTTVDSETINISGSLIRLNYGGTAVDGGLEVTDVTGAGLSTGSLLWDGTNDYWKGGIKGSEIKLLRADGDSVVSGSSQITITNTTGFSTFSSSLKSTDDTLAGRLTSIETFTGSQETKNTTLETVTSSLAGRLDNVELTTSSFSGRLLNLETTSGSHNSRLNNIESFTSSINTTIKTQLDANTVVSSSAQIELVKTNSGSFTTDMVGEGANLYYTDVRVKDKLNAESVVSGSIKAKLDAEGVISGSSQVQLSSITGTTFANAAFTFPNNVTVDGDLTVNGTTTTINSTNLLVEDRFILLNSGSQNPDEGGLVIDEGNGQGHAFVYDSDSSRWGFTASLASDATSVTPDAFAAAVVTTDIEEYRKTGNIRVDDNGDIFIYV